MYFSFLFLHILGASVWAGGHLVLSFVVLPRALRERSPEILLDFERRFERLAIPALVVQILTGLHLAYTRLPVLSEWFSFKDPNSHMIVTKLMLLFITVVFALNAHFRLLPKLNADNLKSMVWHIIPVTVLSVLFILIGVLFRTGGL